MPPGPAPGPRPPLGDGPPCPGCGRAALRPDVVWFGEVPHGMDTIDEAVQSCDVFAAIGTSGVVYPAAALVHYAAARGARTVEINLEAGAADSDFQECRRGPATRLVPEWVEELLADVDG